MKMDESPPDLGDLEREVMQLVWADGPVTAESVRERLARRLKESTVRTVLRLVGDWIGVMYAGRLVEYGPAKEVLGSPRHPYTEALLESLPMPGVARGALVPIKGSAPVAGEVPAGCSFHPRCSRQFGALLSFLTGLHQVVIEPDRSSR